MIMDSAELYYTDELVVKGIVDDFKHSARVKDISKRSKLNSADGNVLDQHDQFYRDHKLLLKLFQVSYFCS